MLDQRILTRPLPKGLDAVCDAGIGLASRCVPRRRRYLRRAEVILDLEKRYAQMTDARLRQAARELQSTYRLNRDTVADLEQTFAIVREVAFRQIGERPFLVQVAGALALHDGAVAEMATGEGKTLAATMAVTVTAWRGKGCHVITVNDYLARRDAEWMGGIYRFCGLTVAHIEQETSHEERKKAYKADITYCTNKEVAADYLRDRLVLGRVRGLCSTLIRTIAKTDNPITDRLVQRGLYYAVVDEADSVLIDEAVTPLIISGEAPNPEQVESFQQAADLARELNLEEDYIVDQRFRDIELTDKGKSRLQKLTESMDGVWKGTRRPHELIIQALTAKELYLRDKQYVVDDEKITIIDEFTGRLMPDRTWRDGLHQAIEAKENVEINLPKDTYARISFQRFFRMYSKLSGMTGTATEARTEFWQIYHMPVVNIPTNRPCKRTNLPTMVLSTENDKWQVIIKEIQNVHKKGRPILIGTRSVRTSEHLSRLLSAENLDHQVLNAVYHRLEAQIVAQAGQEGKVTVATNMAGRGTDIKLGRGVAELGGLHVIAAEPNDSGRIERQLYGRGARQGDPGSARGIFSLEDELLFRYSKQSASHLKKRYAHSTGDISSALVNSVFSYARIKADRMALRQRKSVLKTDHWLDEQLGFSGAE